MRVSKLKFKPKEANVTLNFTWHRKKYKFIRAWKVPNCREKKKEKKNETKILQKVTHLKCSIFLTNASLSRNFSEHSLAVWTSLQGKTWIFSSAHACSWKKIRMERDFPLAKVFSSTYTKIFQYIFSPNANARKQRLVFAAFFSSFF